MVKKYNHVLFVALLLSCATHSYTMQNWRNKLIILPNDTTDSWMIAQFITPANNIEENKEEEINLDSYNALKAAVFAKMGNEYATNFNILHPQPSENGVIKLSKEFDLGSCQLWTQSNPPTTFADINKERFRIKGKIAQIIYKKSK